MSSLLTPATLPRHVTLYTLRSPYAPRPSSPPEGTSPSWAGEAGRPGQGFPEVWYLSPGAALHAAREFYPLCGSNKKPPSALNLIRTTVPRDTIHSYHTETLAIRLHRGTALIAAPWSPSSPTRRAASQLFRRLEEDRPDDVAFSKTSCVHGPEHWERVAHWALVIGMNTASADIPIAYAFAFLHDAFRTTDDDDPEHGPRAAAWLGTDAGYLALQEFLSATGTSPGPEALSRRYGPDGGLKAWTKILQAALRDHSEGHVVALVGPEPPGPLIATLAVCWDADRYDYCRTGTPIDRSLLSTPYAREHLWTL